MLLINSKKSKKGFQKYELIVKLDNTNKLKEIFKNQYSSQVDKVKSMEEQLVEFKFELEKLTSAKLFKEPNSKDNNVYIPPFNIHGESYEIV